MPFFSSRKPEEEVVEPTPVYHEEPKRSHGLFGSRRERSPSPSSTVRTSTTSHSHQSGTSYHTSPSTHGGGGGVFRRSTDASSGRRSLLSRSFGHGNNVEMDPSIVQARERVLSAETAEREADRAMEAARLRVREAREEVKRLELEAAEEAKRAKIKQYHAREVSKRGKQLGRHDL
ncbi:hypothetical protein BKA67DRAFT_661739 [Truncatella angustata]|uniref:Uncharacterized protein n=1 Tax=Truncatella angustata TaxID=152316 RepID=A0A9P8UF55_9PEZI|nr:uncharacterized protein BKA67DRAFT_661739 [Truncatella angustata]KAH6648791.1 hypothetical protein BKA67DRAFT_661739 [Truncatella angustata]KAH8200853.1 hypothetical protein TruAng_004939 [Truncatella angustata]